jgi:hypothetical protein
MLKKQKQTKKTVVPSSSRQEYILRLPPYLYSSPKYRHSGQHGPTMTINSSLLEIERTFYIHNRIAFILSERNSDARR